MESLGLALLSGVFFATDLGLWNSSLLITPVANATLLGNDAPIIVGLIALVVFRERLRVSYWGGLALAVVGMAIVAGPDVLAHTSPGAGDILALCAGLAYALYLTVTQRVRTHMGTVGSLWLPGISGTAVLLVFNLVAHHTLWGFSSHTWSMLLALGLISQVGGWLAINYALGHLRASIVSVTLLGQPVLTAILLCRC